jgi:hypothetical protein
MIFNSSILNMFEYNIESGEGILVKSKDKSQKHLFLNIIIMEVNKLFEKSFFCDIICRIIV